jgi:hypothetical protein
MIPSSSYHVTSSIKSLFLRGLILFEVSPRRLTGRANLRISSRETAAFGPSSSFPVSSARRVWVSPDRFDRHEVRRK